MSPKTELPPELGEGYELTFARLQRMFRARGVPVEEASDLAQETAARLLVHLRRRGLAPNPLHEGISALIHRIAVNLLIDRARAARERAVSLDDAREIIGAEDPADIVSRDYRVRAVRAAVEGLPSRHRRALSLSLQGLGPAEIAEDFGIERNAADALLYRARRRLAQSLRLDQIGVVIALVVARLRDAARRSDLTQPILAAAPGGMQIATGLVGLAMSASLTLPATAAAVATVAAVRAPAPVTRSVSTTHAPAIARAASVRAAAVRRQHVTVTTRVPGSTRSGDGDVGFSVWQEKDGRGTTGPILDHGTTAACSAAACSGDPVLR